MRTDTPLLTDGRSTSSVLRAFVRWYAGRRPREIVASYLEYAGAFGEAFAILFMLKTLVAPWKSITDEYPSKGFNLEAIVATFFLNLTSRAIGFVIRVSAIVMGLLIQIGLAIGFVAYLALWLAYPVLLLFAVPFFLVSF